MIVQNNIKKTTVPKKFRAKTFQKKFKKTSVPFWATVLIVQKKQNAAKNQTLSLVFLYYPLI